ncbi:MAG: protein CpxP [Gammaproteobacteria bacterium]|jgi:protein CpxP
MKKILIALAVAAVIPVAAYAAMDGHGKRDPGERLERMAARLNLDDSQKMRMQALFEENKAERDALREQMRAQIRDILNAEQVAKMEQMRAKRREHRKAKHAARQKQDCGAAKTS